MSLIKKIYTEATWPIHYAGWLFRYGRFLLGMNIVKDIKILSIEFSSICNLRCKYCYLDKLERPKTLDIGVYEKLIKEVSENPGYHIRTMEWPISGEFFVYPHFKEVIEITKRYMDENPHFRPWIILNENLTLMNEERTDLILKSGVVKQLICSIDGHNHETFEDMRPPAKFDVILQRMRWLKRRNEELGFPVHIQINNGRDERSWGKEFSEEMKEILRMGNSVTQWQPEHWNESFNKPQRYYRPAKGFCSFVFNNVTLTSSGYISKCCMDLRGQTEYADLRKNSLEDIWHSKTRREYLNLMFRDKRARLKGCRNCSLSYVDNDNRYNNFIRNAKRKILTQIRGKEYFFMPFS